MKEREKVEGVTLPNFKTEAAAWSWGKNGQVGDKTDRGPRNRPTQTQLPDP